MGFAHWSHDVGGFKGDPSPSFAYSLPMHPVHTRMDRVASLPPCRLYGAVIPRAPPLGPGRALTLPCGWNNAGPELYLRWTQFGALSPLYRSHGTKGSNRAYWSPAYASVFSLIQQSLALRLALVPYLYTSARQAHDSGMAAVHSLYLDWPSLPQARARP